MKPIEQRVYDLERRVETLEKQLNEQRKGQPTNPTIIAPTYHREKYPKEPVRKRDQQTLEYHELPKKESKYKLKEALVGKYVVGALASLLVFIGAISLVVLLWDAITPQIKLTLLVLTSIVITGIGYMRILKEKNHINSIILGTGAGLLFISIISSYMYFRYISSNVAFMLSGLWALLFIFSYKYTKTYFTTVIAYTGSYIATVLGLSLVMVNMQLNIIIVFVTSVAVALLVSGYKWLNKKQQLINMLLSITSYTTVMFWIWSKSVFMPKTRENLVYLLFLSLVIYLIKNMANIILNGLQRENHADKYLKLKYLPALISLALGFMVGIFLIGSLGTLGKNIFIALSLVQILLTEWKFKSISREITLINILFIAFLNMVYADTILISLLGLLLLMVLLILIDTVKKSRNYEDIKMLLIIFAMKEIFTNVSIIRVNLLAYSLVLLAIILSVVKIFYDKYKSKDKSYMVTTKIIFYLLVIQSVVSVVSECIYRKNEMLVAAKTSIDSGAILYFLVSIIVVLAVQLGYFKNWFSPDFNWKRLKSSHVEEDKSYALFYISTFLMYFIGLFKIGIGLEEYNIVLMTLSVLAIMTVQTMEILKYRKRTEIIGAWEGLKYLVYIWVVMTSVFGADMASVTTSIVGLVVALVSISLGFKYKMKGLRLYGLAVTLLMVFKVITIDMGGQNSITRVISLIIGGIICFVISVVYNKIDKSIED